MAKQSESRQATVYVEVVHDSVPPDHFKGDVVPAGQFGEQLTYLLAVGAIRYADPSYRPPPTEAEQMRAARENAASFAAQRDAAVAEAKALREERDTAVGYAAELEASNEAAEAKAKAAAEDLAAAQDRVADLESQLAETTAKVNGRVAELEAQLADALKHKKK